MQDADETDETDESDDEMPKPSSDDELFPLPPEILKILNRTEATWSGFDFKSRTSTED